MTDTELKKYMATVSYTATIADLYLQTQDLKHLSLNELTDKYMNTVQAINDHLDTVPKDIIKRWF